MSDEELEDWERGDFPAAIAGAAIAAKVAPKPEWEGEDEDAGEQKRQNTFGNDDDLVAVQAELEKVRREFASYKKGVEAEKLKKQLKKDGDKALMDGLLTEAQLKERDQKLVEDADLKNAMDLFGSAKTPHPVATFDDIVASFIGDVVLSGSTSATPLSPVASAEAAKAKEKEKDELVKIVDAVSLKLSKLTSSRDYAKQVERLVTSITGSFDGESQKKLGEYLASVGKDKRKQELEKEKKKKQAESKKPALAKGGMKANASLMNEYEDDIAGEDGDYDAPDEYDDFM